MRFVIVTFHDRDCLVDEPLAGTEKATALASTSTARTRRFIRDPLRLTRETVGAKPCAAVTRL